jgi:hypothetical protein
MNREQSETRRQRYEHLADRGAAQPVQHGSTEIADEHKSDQDRAQQAQQDRDQHHE